MENIFIYMDDSGKLTNDPYVLYGGLVFTSKEDNDVFIRKYNTIINRFKCNDKYCTKKRKSCDKKCPEIKSSRLEGSHRRQLMNLINKELTYFTIIEVGRLTRINLNNPLDVGRYQEYAQKLAIRQALEFLKFNNHFKVGEEYTITIYIDQDTHISNAYYNFESSLRKELFAGFYKGGFVVQPVFNNKNYKVKLVCKQNQESHYVVGIQASDIFVGTARRNKLFNESKYKDISSTSIKLRLP